MTGAMMEIIPRWAVRADENRVDNGTTDRYRRGRRQWCVRRVSVSLYRNGPGIVMLHEILGITLWIEEVADQLPRVDTAWSHPTCSGGWNPDLLPITGFGRARKRHALSRRDQAR